MVIGMAQGTAGSSHAGDDLCRSDGYDRCGWVVAGISATSCRSQSIHSA